MRSEPHLRIYGGGGGIVQSSIIITSLYTVSFSFTDLVVRREGFMDESTYHGIFVDKTIEGSEDCQVFSRDVASRSALVDV